MTDSLDCKWIENNLEALFCDRLEPEQDRLARAHIESCASCGREVQVLNAIDPLVRKHLHNELAAARRPRVVHAGRVFGLSAAALALGAMLLFAVLRPSPATPVAPSAARPAVAQASPAEEIPAPAPSKSTENAGAPVERVKPANALPKPPDELTVARPVPSDSTNAPDFLVVDPAGYSHRLSDFRGHVVIIAVWSGASPEAIANFERLYKAHGADSRFRFLGVSTAHVSKPANATFPVFYNKGSKVLGIQSGDFVVLAENGEVALRGSLVKNFDGLRKAVQGQ